MDIFNPNYARALSDFMFINALLVGGCGKGFFAAWHVIEIDPRFRGEMTQRKRRFILFMSQAILLGAGGYMLSFGRSKIWYNMNQWTHGTGPIGYIVWVTVAFTILSPLLTVLTLIHIYRKPSRLAYRLPSTYFIRGGALYYKTEDVRNGEHLPVRSISYPWSTLKDDYYA